MTSIFTNKHGELFDPSAELIQICIDGVFAEADREGRPLTSDEKDDVAELYEMLDEALADPYTYSGLSVEHNGYARLYVHFTLTANYWWALMPDNGIDTFAAKRGAFYDKLALSFLNKIPAEDQPYARDMYHEAYKRGETWETFPLAD